MPERTSIRRKNRSKRRRHDETGLEQIPSTGPDSRDITQALSPEASPHHIAQLQRVVGNKRAGQIAGQQPHFQRSEASLPPVRGLAPAGTQLVFRKLPPPRATIQRNPLQDAIAPHLKQLTLLASKGGSKLMAALGETKETAKGLTGKIKDTVKYKYDTMKAKEKLKEKEKSKTNKKEEGTFAKLKKYTFGSDFTFESRLSDNLEDMPTDMAALQLQIANVGQMIDNTTTLYRQSKGAERKRHFESLEELNKMKADLQQKLMDLMKVYGKKQSEAILKMQELLVGALPQDVIDAGKKQKLDPSLQGHREALLELYEAMHPIEFREKEISARQVAFGNVDESFMPLRNTPEGQLLSDVRKDFTTESLDEERLEREKKDKKKKESDSRFKAKLALGAKAKRGETVTDEEKESANEGKMPEEPKKEDNNTPPTTGRQRSGAISGTRWQTAKPSTGTEIKKALKIGPQIKIGGERKETRIKESDKITEKSDTASGILDKITTGTKFARTPVGMMVNKISGGTQDDEGLLKAIPTVPALGSEIADMAGSILLITEGNRAQKKLGQKKLFDNIFAVFNSMGMAVRSALKSAEQFQLTEAMESSGAATTLTELGVPIVGIITSGAKLVKSGIDAGMQGKTGGVYKSLSGEAKTKGGQSGALRGALKHGQERMFQLMGRSIAKGVTAGLALVGNILTVTGVGAIVGESIKLVTRGISLAQKVGETLQDSFRAGKALESQYKAKVNVKGSEKEVFKNSPKYASTALLRRALDGDELALKAVKEHGIDAKMLDDIRTGKVLFAQARELIMHDWKEKDKPETLGMKLKEGLDKVKKTLAKLLEDEKEKPPERKDMNIVHLGEDVPMGPWQQEDFDNPTDYEEPKQKKGKLEKVKDTLKGVGTTVKGIPSKAGKAITGLPGKVSKAVGKTYNYDMKLKVVKWKFIKTVKDAIMYGGEKRGGNWVINRILSTDSDADEQFQRVKEMLFKNELFKDDEDTQKALVEQLLEIMQTELSMKQKYKIKPEKEKEKEYYKY